MEKNGNQTGVERLMIDSQRNPQSRLLDGDHHYTCQCHTGSLGFIRDRHEFTQFLSPLPQPMPLVTFFSCPKRTSQFSVVQNLAWRLILECLRYWKVQGWRGISWEENQKTDEQRKVKRASMENQDEKTKFKFFKGPVNMRHLVPKVWSCFKLQM